MLIRSKQFEHNMKLRVRDSLIENPREQEISLQKRKAAFWNRFFVRRVVPVLGVLGGLFMLAMSNMAVVGAFGEKGKEFNGIPLILAFASLAIASLTLIMAAVYRESFFCTIHTNALSHLPMSDDEYHRRWIRRTEIASFVISGTFMIPAYCYLIWEYRLGFLGILEFVVAIFLHAILGKIVSEKIGKRIPLMNGLAVFGMLSTFAVLILAASGVFLKSDADAIAFPIFILTPFGWVNGFLYHGFYSGNLWGWLFLVPIFAVLYLYWKQKTVPYRIREFQFLAPRKMVIALDPGFATPMRRFELTSEPSVKEFAKGVAEKFNRTLQPEEATQKILDRSFLDLDKVQSPDWLQRRLYSFVGHRTRVVMDAHRLKFPSWSRLWKSLAVLILFAAAYRFVPMPPSKNPDARFLVLSPVNMAIMGFFLFCGRQELFTQNSHRSRCIEISFPIGFREVTKANFLSMLIVAGLFIPVIVPLGLVVSFWFSLNPYISIICAISPIFLCVCCVPYFVSMGVSSFTNDTKRISVLIAWFFSSFVVLPGSMILLLFPWNIAGAISAIVVPLASFGMWRYFDYLIHHTKIDFRLSTGGDLRR